ncbi:unconventional myosin-Vb isoform X3 [Dunckerocampus dactyliophorus]|uniref:unconventional myosin-Vb isoform X3 n=1 Tax=Dunckerocampus dactyliophorus TaxID=161453 RepID=UPI00240628E1|nr:unconventional myosin-Vb isoform X3 [Dunckerocampus dactyliophorus]
MATLQLYTKGASVWIPDPDAVWVSAQLLQDYTRDDKHVLLQLPGGEEECYPVAAPSDLPPLANPDISEGESDLTALSFLHEPAILHNLRVRFLDYNSIYTYCGIVLVAINPYDQLPIYGEEVIDAYSGQDMADMEPHIFSVAEDAYRTMMREEKNQSIIISGESGSGKTVSAKFTMRYFAVVGGAAQQTSVEDKVLASNPIMEAFGNAKTTRNDNSSRFGKYIQIGFSRKGAIIGANMSTYLLEKSRVVFQAPAERNYHIFYQLCASRQLPEMRSLKLATPEHFRYTNQGGDANIPCTDDVMEMERTCNAFSILGRSLLIHIKMKELHLFLLMCFFSTKLAGVLPEQQMELFRILAAVLHLGNVNIQASGRSSERSYIDADDVSLAIFSKLLGVEAAVTAHWLCHRRLILGGETLVKPISGQQAIEARDALAKHIYEQMFKWTVHRLNAALRSQLGRTRSFIGVLDIYGCVTELQEGCYLALLQLTSSSVCSFETFERNSFEQFCINYANEKLQQQFNRHVFHLEQEEYEREELTWSRIEFSDNQQCILLIEGQLGLLDLLDEECRMPKGSDDSWVQKLYDKHLTGRGHPHFRKPRMSNSAFIILHSADMVQYEGGGFLDKNRDTIFEELVNVLKASQSELVAELFQQQGNKPSVANGSVRSGRRAHREHKLTVGFQFRQSLQLLMDTLNSTTPHYVRCIKPNDLKRPFMFDPKRTVQQLRACGVLETIRISAAGFPSRWTYEEFFFRYRVLLHGCQGSGEVQLACRQALPQLIPDPDQYVFGRTKVFFRAGQVALLERLRAERLRMAAVVLQSWVRRWLARIHYTRTLWATITIQRYCRGALARRLALILRYTKAALVIQKTYRMLVARNVFHLVRQAAITIQAFIRGTLARRKYRLLVEERAASLLQARVRGWLARRAFTRFRAAVVFAQCCVRRRAAKRELLKLKTEARSVERYRELNKGMEVKLMQLQMKADQVARERAALKESLRVEREAAANELSALRATIQKLEEHQKRFTARPVSILSEEEQQERRRAEEKAARELLQLTQEVEALQREKASLSTERDRLSACLLQQEQAQEALVQQAVSRATAAVRVELDEERRKHQGLLREFTRLEQRYDNLREMSQLTQGYGRTDSTQSLEPLSPSPQSLSPFTSAFPSPEEVRRISVTSPSTETRVWSLETSMDQLMNMMDVTKKAAVELKEEDLAHAYDVVRVANKCLESQLQSQRSEWEQEVEMLKCQLRQASSGLSAHQQALLEAREQECVRLRRELKGLRSTVPIRRLLTQVFPSTFLTESSSSSSQQKAASTTGLLECKKRDENKLIKNLITDVRTDIAVSLPPGLPASVVFLCVRQADCRGDQTSAYSLCRAAVTAMKTALKKHTNDVAMTALWLKNICLLHDLLNQHAPKQTNDPEEVQPLNFDLRDSIRTLSDLRIQAYQQLISIPKTQLQNFLASALLEGEDVPGLKPVGSRKRAGSEPRTARTDAPTMASVLKELWVLHDAMSHQALHPALMEQAFHQLTYFISASALNSLLLRKDMCCCSRGILIRLNVSQLEEWLRCRDLQTEGAVASMEPLIQAVQLLQVGKKTEKDAEALLQTCTALNSDQIVRILSNYTPHSDLDEKVSLNFIRMVQGLLKGSAHAQPLQLLLDIKREFPVTFPDATPPVVRADMLVIPDSLKISFIRRV